MSVDIFPTGIDAGGNNLAIVTPTLPTALTDLVSGFDFTCYLMADGLQIGFSQETQDDTRFCDSYTRNSAGQVTFEMDNISHIVDPQGAGTEPGNMAVAEIEANSEIYISMRLGVPKETEPTATDKWDIYRFQLGEEHTPVPAGARGKYLRQVKVISIQRVAKGKSFAA